MPRQLEPQELNQLSTLNNFFNDEFESNGEIKPDGNLGKLISLLNDFEALREFVYNPALVGDEDSIYMNPTNIQSFNDLLNKICAKLELKDFTFEELLVQAQDKIIEYIRNIEHKFNEYGNLKIKLEKRNLNNEQKNTAKNVAKNDQAMFFKISEIRQQLLLPTAASSLPVYAFDNRGIKLAKKRVEETQQVVKQKQAKWWQFEKKRLQAENRDAEYRDAKLGLEQALEKYTLAKKQRFYDKDIKSFVWPGTYAEKVANLRKEISTTQGNLEKLKRWWHKIYKMLWGIKYENTKIKPVRDKRNEARDKYSRFLQDQIINPQNNPTTAVGHLLRFTKPAAEAYLKSRRPQNSQRGMMPITEEIISSYIKRLENTYDFKDKKDTIHNIIISKNEALKNELKLWLDRIFPSVKGTDPNAVENIVKLDELKEIINQGDFEAFKSKLLDGRTVEAYKESLLPAKLNKKPGFAELNIPDEKKSLYITSILHRALLCLALDDDKSSFVNAIELINNGKEWIHMDYKRVLAPIMVHFGEHVVFWNEAVEHKSEILGQASSPSPRTGFGFGNP